jgi:dipeptide transport system permease protein
VLVAILGPGLTNAMIAIALVCQPHFVAPDACGGHDRTRPDYVVAVRTAGAGPIR